MNTYMGEAKKVLEVKGGREKIVLRAKHAAVIAALKKMSSVFLLVLLKKTHTYLTNTRRSSFRLVSFDSSLG